VIGRRFDKGSRTGRRRRAREGTADDRSRSRHRPTFRFRAPPPAASRGAGEHGRDDDRMVRFPGLWPDGGARLRKIVLSQVRSADRDVGGVRGIRRRLCRTTDRRGDFRPLRRSHRPQGGIDRHPADDRPLDLFRRLRADLRADRCLGCGADGRVALHSGDRRRRRMGRLGPAVDGMGAYRQEPRADRVMGAIWRPSGIFPRQPRDPRLQPHFRRRVPRLGLAHPVLAEPDHGGNRALYPGSASSRRRSSSG
jgi:hypothetical protein